MGELISLIASKNTHVTYQSDGSLWLVQESNDVRDTQQVINLSASDVTVMLSILKLHGIEGVTL